MTAGSTIVKAAIYPSIGIARVGNSPKEYLIGPEVPDAPAPPEGHRFYRDSQGRLKRQAARFRVYGLNAAGQIVRELTALDKSVAIQWTARLANLKAAWYTFQIALDIPEAAAATPTTLRNPTVADRSLLKIVPSPQRISGCDTGPAEFNDGSFMGTKVYLGEIRTDESGRLIVLGGHGVSGSADGSVAYTFANNEGWYDDVSDGPVTAEVSIDGRKLEVDPAWVVVAPPNYAPLRKSVRTMWDLMRDVAIANKQLTAPERPSFTREILPIFQRMNGLQWVNAGYAATFGWNGVIHFGDADFLTRLADNGEAEKGLRLSIAVQFRDYSIDSWSPKPWPWSYGDAMNNPPAQTPRQNSTLSDTQMSMLKKWAAGEFESDYDPKQSFPASIDEVPVAVQGETLTRAALEYCLADAFHPGCEMTWSVRQPGLYMGPFRFAHQPPEKPEPGLGQILTFDNIDRMVNGPLMAQWPGGITRWMALPWQCDTASCRSGYDKRHYDPYLPTFWAARVPNQVLTLDNYDIVVDTSKSMDDRIAAFATRTDWDTPLNLTASYSAQINNMVTKYGEMGVVAQMPGPKDTDQFPKEIEVADLRQAAPPADSKTSLAAIDKVRRFKNPRRVLDES